MREFLQICHKRPLELKDELIRIWWSKMKGHCDLTKHVFGHDSRIHTLIMTAIDLDPNVLV